MNSPDRSIAAPSFRHIPFVTIDGESTRDIDDALHFEKLDVGYRILVAIANPVGLVPIGSTEDEQARLIAATAYIRDRPVRRMLPPVISEHKGSLVAGKERLAVVFEITLNEMLEATSTAISLSPITVAHRLCHADIPTIMGDPAHPLRPAMALASTLGRLLLDNRRRHGALALYDLSRLLLTDEEGHLQILHSVDEVIGYIIVQEVMILTNHETARWMIERDIPCLFRNHEPRLAAPRSDELAATIEVWLKGASFDSQSVQTQFSAIAGRAQYGASTKGHYGLSLPSYVHITSPLRRYADLVNMRQLVAQIKEKPLPYDKEALTTMAIDLNEAIEKRKEERSEGFKEVVRRTAGTALERGQLGKLADHELRQAIKLARETGYLPDALSEELVRRFDRAIITDILINTVLVEISNDLLSDALRAAIARWLAEDLSRTMKIINYGQQTGFFVEVSIDCVATDDRFVGSVVLRNSEGKSASAKGTRARKKEAEQVAALCALADILGLPAATPDQDPVATESGPMASASTKNYKGMLIELCQKHRWPMPSFESNGKGPAHAMVFAATVRATVNGREYVAQSDRAANKKEAEASAASKLLTQLSALIPAIPPIPATSGTSNPVGALQELAQKNGFPPPTYNFEQTNDTPPRFRCTVTTHGGQIGSFVGEGGTKQAAKANAAALALGA